MSISDQFSFLNDFYWHKKQTHDSSALPMLSCNIIYGHKGALSAKG